jgi:hypothetical protein
MRVGLPSTSIVPHGQRELPHNAFCKLGAPSPYETVESENLAAVHREIYRPL